jgi:cytochrome c-type biogenesis protein CcmH/NrfG
LVNRNFSQVVNNFSNYSTFNNFGAGGRGGWGRRGGWGGWSTPYLYGYGWGSPWYGSGWGGLLGAALYGLGGFGYGGSYYNDWGYGGGYCGPVNGYFAYSPVGYVDYGAYAVSDSYAPDYYASLTPSTTVVGVTAAPVVEQPAILPEVSGEAAANATSYTDQGEAAFKAGDYQGAVYAWRHAVVDDPQNGLVVMMLGQALFATEKFDEAAGATQAAMQLLPKDQWGVVIASQREIYGENPDYTNQLRALESAVKDKSDNPALRFLLGFHYAYLGYPREAVAQLEKGLKLAPRDEAARQLQDEMRTKLASPVTESAAALSADVP